MVSLVLVAHSQPLLDALAALIAQVVHPCPPCFTAGGTDDGRFGTSLERVTGALGAALDASAAGALVLYDSGSAWLTIGFALDEMAAHEQARVAVSDGPLVEGALSAAARAGDGASLDEVAEAAGRALETDKRPAANDGGEGALKEVPAST